jgi:hypothetical protein
MKHAALSRGHWRKGIRPATLANLLYCRLSGKMDLPVPLCFEALSVKEDEVMFFGFEPEDLGSDMLDGMQKLTVASKK